MNRFLISDETVNSYGFRVLTSGIDTSRFEKNPVMLWMHERGYSTLPLGKWKELKKENGQLTAEPEFDTDDDFAMKISKKVDKGIINGVSMKIEIKELSNELMVEGQSLETVSESELIEISYVDYPSNKNSVRLFHKGEEIKIDENTVSLMAGEASKSINPKNVMSMKKVIAHLGLGDNSTEDAIVQAISTRETEAAQLRAEVKSLKDQIEGERKTRALALVDDAVKAGKILGEKKDAFVALAMADYDNVKGMLEGIAPRKELASHTRPSTPTVPGTDPLPEVKDFRELTLKEDEVYERFKAEKPAEFRELYKKEYGRYPAGV